MNIYQIFKAPILTEKSNFLKESVRQVSLKVDRYATKQQIKIAVEKCFQVQVNAVRTQNYAGKIKRLGKNFGKQISWKKAILTIDEKSDLDVFGVWKLKTSESVLDESKTI